jgi:hypothetical protein
MLELEVPQSITLGTEIVRDYLDLSINQVFWGALNRRSSCQSSRRMTEVPPTVISTLSGTSDPTNNCSLLIPSNVPQAVRRYEAVINRDSARSIISIPA